MKLLALEAGGAVLSAALFENGHAVGEAFLRAPQRQTEQLAPLVDGLLRRHQWRPADLEALACGKGPGSFTGLRSSMAFGVGCALAVEGLRLVPVSTLYAWAEAFCPSDASQAMVCLDGRRSQVFRGVFRREAGGWTDTLMPALVDRIFALGERKNYPDAALLSDLTSLGPWTPHPIAMDSAALALAVGRLACAILASKAEPEVWEPEYLRRSEVEILWERLHPPAPIARPGPVGAA